MFDRSGGCLACAGGRFGRRRARAAAKAEEDKKEKQEGVVELLLELESNEPFSASDYDAIKSYFIGEDQPYEDRPYIRKVSFGPVRISPGARHEFRLFIDGHYDDDWRVAFTTRPAK